MQLSARIRAICIVFALLMVPGMVHATDYYLVGDFNKWTPSDTYKFTVSGTTATLSLTGAQINSGSTEFLIKAVESSSNSWFLKNSSFTTVTVNGVAVPASSDYNKYENCNYKVSDLSKESTTTYTFTLTAKGTDINNSQLKITSATTGGGGTTTSANQPGIYLYGQDFGSTDPNKHLTYKFLRKNDSEYHFALYAGSMKFSVEKYEQDRGKLDITPSWNNWQFKIAYIDADGNVSTFCPSSNYTLTSTDGTASTSKNFGNNTQWTIQDNGGLYDLVVKVDANGKPTSWYYESDPNRIVSYKASFTSNWTTEGFLYCIKSADKNAASYNKNFFGTVPMVKDEEFKFITGNYWLGQRHSQGTYDKNVAITGSDGTDAPNLVNPYDGIYLIEYNLDRTDYQLAGNDQTPLRIFMIGSALNNNLSNTYTDWDPADAVELVYDSEEQCYKGTVSLAKKGEFRFLRDTNTSGSATSLKLNFGEDSNKPGNGGDTDANNHVAYNDDSSKGTNVVFNPETNTYNVRFYIEAGTDMSSFNWNSAKYRYTIELPIRLSTTITPPTATVAYGASLTPRVAVVGTTNATRTYAYTTDGTAPTIDTTTGKATGTTKVVTYTYDSVIPTNDLGTFYMAPGNVLTFIDNEGKTSTLTGNTVTVKAQAVQTVTEGSKYRLEGNIATGNYTFETAGGQPGAKYKIDIVNENNTNHPSINKAVLDVTVTNEATNKDDGVDVYYTLDGSDPWNSNTARLVRDRKVTVYGYEIPQNTSSEKFSQGYIRVAINNKTYTGTTFDITYSTSEGGYVNYQSNSAGKKTIGGDDKVVVYVKPVSPNKTYTVGKEEKRIPFIYAYERVKEGDEYVAKSLTTSHQILSSDGNTWGDWLYFVLEPATGYKDINVTMGYKENDAYTTTDATVANVCKDVFLEFNVETGQIKDVTHENTKDFFYTTGNDGTKIETANPKENDKPFIYVQVPSTWVSNGNSVKVLNGTSELSATVAVQPAAQTSDFSNVCKITLNNAPDDNTELTIQPYNEKNTSSVSFKIKYQNGGYYYYESDKHYSATALLVFGQYSDNNTDKREYTGYYDPNHLKEVGNGDKTNILSKEWTYSTEPSSSKTTTADDNWTGSSATVNVIPAGTTISQEVTGLTASTPYTVQMIVRGKSGATGKLSLNEATDGTATDSKSFTGYDAAGTITTDGRVEALLSGTNNGWQKLEATAKASTDGKLTISLKAANADMELSDVTLLENANTKGHVWTTVPTNSTTTEYFLTDDKHSDEIGTTNDSFDRYYANSFSFFDRGVNYNAVVYVSDKTAVGMSPNTYNIAVPITTSGGSAKAYSPRRAPETAMDGDSEAAYTGHKLALYDNTGSWTNDHTWGATENVKWDSFNFDRHFLGTSNTKGTRNTICLPFAMTSDQITSIFGEGAKIYEISSIDESALSVVYGTAVTETKANTPYILEIPNDKDGVSMSGSVTSVSTPTTLSSVIGSSSVKYPSQLVGVYSYTNIQKKEDGNYRYYGYDAEKNGIFNFFKKTGADFKPFRAYLEVSKSTSSTAKAFYYFKVKDSSTTGINNVDIEASLSDNAPVYNLQGQMVRKAGEKTALPKGIFIQNGRKFIQK